MVHGATVQFYDLHTHTAIHIQWMVCLCCSSMLHKQGITFAAVNAHHTNGLAEQKMRELQGLARANLIHATEGGLTLSPLTFDHMQCEETPSLKDGRWVSQTNVHKDHGEHQSKTLQAFWMPCSCLGQCSCNQKHISQMERTIQSGNASRQEPRTCKECDPSPEPGHRTCESTVPC